ncbi:MAG TPA: metalloregulator ArsR/SmtB family transcription factor [bacterium]
MRRSRREVESAVNNGSGWQAQAPRTPEACVILFQAMGDPIRFGLVRALLSRSEHVGELARRLRVRPARVSHHLAILRAAGLVEAIREGQCVRYRLTGTFPCCARHGGRSAGFPCLTERN